MTKSHRYELRETLYTLSRLPGCFIDGMMDRSLMKFPSSLRNNSTYLKNRRSSSKFFIPFHEFIYLALFSSHARSSWYYSRSDLACVLGPCLKNFYCQPLLNASTGLLTLDEAVKNIAQLMNEYR